MQEGTKLERTEANGPHPRLPRAATAQAPHGPEQGPTVSARPLPSSPALGTTTTIRGASHVRPVARKPVEPPLSSRDGPWDNALLVLADGAETRVNASVSETRWNLGSAITVTRRCCPASVVGFQVTKSAFHRPTRQGDAALRRGLGEPAGTGRAAADPTRHPGRDVCLVFLNRDHGAK